MKIRIKGNSIRLRLMRAEVARMLEEGRVEEVTSFVGGGRLAYSLEKSAVVATLEASFDGRTLAISVPTALLEEWANSELVSLEQSLALPDGSTQRLLVEKDFRCLTFRTDEDESDTFPNPNTHC